MRALGRMGVVAAAVLAASSTLAREACQERTLSLRYTPQAGSNWCWAASSQMVMELLGVEQKESCQCRQAEQVLGVAGCCATSSACVPAGNVPARCDEARWPSFVERPDRYEFEYRTTCDGLPNRQDDDACETSPLGWMSLSAELCAGRPVLAAFRSPGATRGHMVVVKGFSIHGGQARAGRGSEAALPARAGLRGRAGRGLLDPVRRIRRRLGRLRPLGRFLRDPASLGETAAPGPRGKRSGASV